MTGQQSDVTVATKDLARLRRLADYQRRNASSSLAEALDAVVDAYRPPPPEPVVVTVAPDTHERFLQAPTAGSNLQLGDWIHDTITIDGEPIQVAAEVVAFGHPVDDHLNIVPIVEIADRGLWRWVRDDETVTLLVPREDADR